MAKKASKAGVSRVAAAPAPAEPAAPVHGRQGGYLAKRNSSEVELDNMPNTYPPELKAPLSVFTQSIMAAGNEFEDKIGGLLAQLNPSGDVVILVEEGRTADGERTEEGKRKKEEQTWAAYRDPKVRFVFNARMGSRFEELVSEYFGEPITDLDRVSEPDAIEFGELMANGLRAMRFIDVKWHRVTSGSSTAKMYPTSPLSSPFFPGELNNLEEFTGALHASDFMQLAHYYRHGESLRLVDGDESLWGAVIGKEEKLVWSRLDRATFMKYDSAIGKRRKQSPLEMYDAGFAHGLAIVDNALARDLDPTVPRLNQPEWRSELKESPWREVIVAELTGYGDGGHITLLPGITPDRARPYYAAGITSIGDLARLEAYGTLDGVKDLATAVFQARVFKAGKVCRAPGVEKVNLSRASFEYDFDYETTTGDDGLVYMRGIRTRSYSRRNGQVAVRTRMQWFDDYTETSDGELNAYREFWSFVTEAIRKAKRARKSVKFFHYTQFEKHQDMRLSRKYAGQPGVPTVEEVEDFYSSSLVVDMYEVLSRMLVWPTRTHSIKDLAKWARFSWRGDQVGGDLSMIWYQNVVGHPDPQVRAENLSILREYNEDDVAAQTHLRDWITSLEEARTPGDKIPSVLSLPAPVKTRARAA